MIKRKISTIFFIIATMIFFTQISSHSSNNEIKSTSYLKIGEAVSLMKMEDIDGKEKCNKDYIERVIVYSFGDRESNKPLQEAVIPCGKKVLRQYPGLSVAYINVADLQAVPSLFKHIVNPILKYINENNKKELKDSYAREGLPLNEKQTTFMLIPDWDSDVLKVFGLKDAREWISFVTYKGKVYGIFDARTKNFDNEFLKIFGDLEKQVRSGK